MMSNRKRVTLTFEIDDHDGYNDEAFMRRDFLQELVCCVNDPYEDTFVMKVEGADDPHEMSAVEYEIAKGRWSKWCFSQFSGKRFGATCEDVRCEYLGRCLVCQSSPEKKVAFIEKWAREHPEEANIVDECAGTQANKRSV